MAETRVALVTGGNRGIGLEIARQLARQGYLTVIGSRDLAAGQKAAESLMSEGLEVHALALDVSDSESIRQTVRETAGLLERIDVLVNNAGVYLDKPGAKGPNALSADLKLVMRSFEINTVAPLRMIQAVVPLMRDRGYGRIVNMSSIMGQLAEMGGGSPGYRASKTALNAITRCVAAELAGTNIKVNAAHPGWVRTDMGGPDAPVGPEQGADTAVWLAGLPDDGPSGGFFSERKPLPW